MGLNWLDIILVLILLIALTLGILKGLIRQIVSILAVVVGLILALTFYSVFVSAFSILIKDETLGHFLGFMLIFFAVIIIGWLIGRMFSKAVKGPFKFFNHVLGGVLGILKGALICGILVFALLVFPVDSEVLQKSSLAPWCVEITRGIIDLIPEELKQAFSEAYQDIFEKEGEGVTRI